MPRAEVVTNWPVWFPILDNFESQGERRISDEDNQRTIKGNGKAGGNRSLAEVSNELFRILT